MSKVDELSILREEPLSEAITRFTGITNSSNALVFLIGAGCSRCAGLPLMSELTDQVLSADELDQSSKEILSAVRDKFVGGKGSNIEDYLSEIVDLLAITDRRADREVEENTVVVGDGSYCAEQLRGASLKIKHAIAISIDRKVNVDIHHRFVSSVHQPLRVGRQNLSQPVEYLVLNYDTMIEDALAMAKIPYADGLNGGGTAWWAPDAFDATGVSARVLKLHGSIDWYQFPDDPFPRRIGSAVELPTQDDIPLLIWPSATKYQEAQLDPFAQLLTRARSALRAHAGSQRLLVICGYSFADRHINLEISRALRESDGNLTVAVFTNSDEPTGQLKDWRDDSLVRDQVLIFCNRGFYHGDFMLDSSEDVPWWKFEI